MVTTNTVTRILLSASIRQIKQRQCNDNDNGVCTEQQIEHRKLSSPGPFVISFKR